VIVKPVPIKAFCSFAEAERAEREEYRAMTAEQRLELVSQLRALRPDDATAPGLERVLRVTQLAKG
jgi:hypothetical protein